MAVAVHFNTVKYVISVGASPGTIILFKSGFDVSFTVPNKLTHVANAGIFEGNIVPAPDEEITITATFFSNASQKLSTIQALFNATIVDQVIFTENGAGATSHTFFGVSASFDFSGAETGNTIVMNAIAQGWKQDSATYAFQG